jgi:hypothetical protein
MLFCFLLPAPDASKQAYIAKHGATEGPAAAMDVFKVHGQQRTCSQH